jgi:superfamily I DNA and RNA helicase
MMGRDLFAEAAKAYPGQDRFDVLAPYALALSTELSLDRFDAIIVDEGQNFGEEYWLPLEMMLQNELQSMLYVFYDPNQSIYKRADSFPNLGDPFLLLTNCRNAREIHAAAYVYFRRDETDPPALIGIPLKSTSGDTPEEQCQRLHERIAQLVSVDRVQPKDSAVLIAGTPKARYYSMLRAMTLPCSAKWAVEDHEAEGAILVDTISRFKGLERAVVVFGALDTLNPNGDRELLYVGISRAKSRLTLGGTEATCHSFMQIEALAPHN